jgi:hypothetical protein
LDNRETPDVAFQIACAVPIELELLSAVEQQARLRGASRDVNQPLVATEIGGAVSNAVPYAWLCAEQRLAADCLQRPLRSRFLQQLKAGVRRLSGWANKYLIVSTSHGEPEF